MGSTGRILLKNTNFETKIMFSLCYANVDFLIKTKSSPKQGIHYVYLKNYFHYLFDSIFKDLKKFQKTSNKEKIRFNKIMLCRG